MSLICAGCNAFSAQVVLCGSCRMPHCPECAVRHAQDRACVKPSISLYPYQVDAVERAMSELNGPSKSSLIVMATGLGKTVTAAEIAKRWLRARGGRVLIVSHREELVHQAAKEFGQYLGNRVEVEMASDRANRVSGRWTSPVVSASIATLVAGRACVPCKEKLQAERADWLIKHPDKTIDDWRGHKIGCVNCLGGMVRRIQEFEAGAFGLVIVDECFPAGTLVDGRPIEDIRAGDYVSSFNHATGDVEARKVVRLFKSMSTSNLVRIRFSSGRTIDCTPSHPFWSPRLRGYIPADTLDIGDMVLTINPYLGNENELQDLRIGDGSSSGTEKAMLGGMRQEIPFFDGIQDQQKARIGTHEGEKSNEARGCPCKGVVEPSGDGVEADRQARKRTWADSASAASSVRSGLGHGGCHTNQDGPHERISDMLQGGYCKPCPDGCGGGRWEFSPSEIAENAGREERCVLGLDRVDSVEILQQGDSPERGVGGSGCVVYNLEVEGNHNYFANGVLVHNCHHAVAKSYQRVLEYLQKTAGAAVLGVTATPDRSDERTLGAIFHSDRFYRYELPDALRDGWLVEPNEVYCRIDSWDLGNVKKDSHDFVQSSLAKEVEKEKSCYEVASAILQHAANKRTLGFCGSVQQAHRVAEILNDDRPGAAVAIDGETDKAFRRKCLADFAAGRIQFVLNFGVFTEGFNERTIECLAMARPTKSRSLYLQMLGRGTRTLQGVLDGIDSVQGRLEAIRNSKKSRLLVLDMHGQAGQHELVSVVDVIGQKLSPKVIDIVKKLARENPARTVQELTDIAAEKARKQEQRRAARAAASAARARSTLVPSRTNAPAPRQESAAAVARPNMPTPRMIASMRAHGVEESRIAKCTIGEAGLIIGMIKKREQMGLCDWRQARLLRKLDITPTNVGRVEAHEIIMRAMRAGKLQ